MFALSRLMKLENSLARPCRQLSRNCLQRSLDVSKSWKRHPARDGTVGSVESGRTSSTAAGWRHLLMTVTRLVMMMMIQRLMAVSAPSCRTLVSRGNPAVCRLSRRVALAIRIIAASGPGQLDHVVLLLPLHAPVLEPDLDLALGESEQVRDLDAPTPGQVAVEVEFLLQLQRLEARVRLPRPLRLVQVV